MVVVPVPLALCRSCRLCCRFSDPEVLTPFSARPSAADVALPSLFKASRPLHLAKGVGLMDLPVFVCDALGEDSRCTLWGTHPADCRLYPLVVVFREGSFLLALDPDCPFTQQVPLSFFFEWAQRFLLEEWPQLTVEEALRLRPLAQEEDRPHYPAVLPLPFPGPSTPA